MKFLDKIKHFFLRVFACFKQNKKLTIITLSVLAVIVVALLVFFLIIKPKIDYPQKIVYVDAGGKEYTQSDIDELGDWWEEYLTGNNIHNEGSLPVEE